MVNDLFSINIILIKTITYRFSLANAITNKMRIKFLINIIIKNYTIKYLIWAFIKNQLQTKQKVIELKKTISQILVCIKISNLTLLKLLIFFQNTNLISLFRLRFFLLHYSHFFCQSYIVVNTIDERFGFEFFHRLWNILKFIG